MNAGGQEAGAPPAFWAVANRLGRRYVASMRQLDIIVIGAGAAGLMAALTAGQRGRRVLLLEHTDAIGAQILVSGGGRGNFTNLGAADPACYIGANPHFARSALARYAPQDFIALVEKHSIPFYEKTLGQLFCEGPGSAGKIVAMLRAECEAGDVEILTNVRVGEVSRSDRFTIETDRGAFTAPSLILATGGLSIPKLGATDFAFRLAERFHLPIEPPAPALVPLTFAGETLDRMRALAGVATTVEARATGPAFREALLFTHRGLSGPAILQISSYWRPGAGIDIDLIPDSPAEWLVALKQARPRASLTAALSQAAPQRLAAALAGDDPRPLADYKDKELLAVAAGLKSMKLFPAGDEGYAKAEVTRGGISTAALDQKTMMAKSVPNLFVVGEAMDVTGWLGGYNFQWAWASGRAAGLAA